MNLNNIFKKVTGVALAATLSFGAFAGNALAAETEPTIPEKTLTSAPTLNKEVEVSGGKYFGGGTFTYTLSDSTAPDTYQGFTPRTSDTDLINIGNGTITIPAGKTTGSLQVNVNTDAVNNALPGVYRYTIKEEASNISGISDDDRTLNIDVFVTSNNGTGRKIAYYIVSDEDGKTDLKFTNTLSQEDLLITKSITGNQSNKSDKFTFEITVTPAGGTTNKSVGYYLGETSDTATPTRVTPGENGSSVITLTNNVTDGTKINLTGLAAGDSVTIKETDPNKYGGYKVTAANTDVTANTDLGTNGVSATVKGNNQDITWENSRTGNTPTGLIENIAPFVLAIAAAGFIFFVYFKRDKNEEEQYA